MQIAAPRHSFGLVAFAGLEEINRQEYVDRAGLQPIIDSFGGKTLNETLVNGAMQAARILSQYVGALTYDKLAADELFDKIQAWQASHGSQLQQYIRSGAETIPEQIRLAFDSKTAQQFIVASFASAANGLPGWKGSAISNAIKTDPTMTQSRAYGDGRSRLVTFSTIVLLERQGVLREIFNPPPGMNGMGAAPVAIAAALPWIIAVVAVAAVCGIVYLALSYKDQQQLNFWVSEKCRRSPAECDATIDQVLQAEIARQGKPALSQVSEAFGLKYLGAAVGIGILAYVGAKYVLPSVLEARKSDR